MNPKSKIDVDHARVEGPTLGPSTDWSSPCMSYCGDDLLTSTNQSNDDSCMTITTEKLARLQLTTGGQRRVTFDFMDADENGIHRSSTKKEKSDDGYQTGHSNGGGNTRYHELKMEREVPRLVRDTSQDNPPCIKSREGEVLNNIRGKDTRDVFHQGQKWSSDLGTVAELDKKRSKPSIITTKKFVGSHGTRSRSSNQTRSRSKGYKSLPRKRPTKKRDESLHCKSFRESAARKAEARKKRSVEGGEVSLEEDHGNVTAVSLTQLVRYDEDSAKRLPPNLNLGIKETVDLDDGVKIPDMTRPGLQRANAVKGFGSHKEVS